MGIVTGTSRGTGGTSTGSGTGGTSTGAWTTSGPGTKTGGTTGDGTFGELMNNIIVSLLGEGTTGAPLPVA